MLPGSEATMGWDDVIPTVESWLATLADAPSTFHKLAPATVPRTTVAVAPPGVEASSACRDAGPRSLPATATPRTTSGSQASHPYGAGDRPVASGAATGTGGRPGGVVRTP